MAKVKKLLKNKVIRDILSALAVAFFGFILLNLTFILDFIYQSLVAAAIRLFTPNDLFMEVGWFPPVMHASFVAIVGLISLFVFRSKLRVLYKAIYMTVPAAVALVTIGMALYRWPLLSFGIAGLLCIGTLLWFHRTKQPWLYYYTVILVGAVLSVFSLMGGEI